MGLYNGVVGNAANMLNGMGIFMTVVNTVGLPLLKDIRSVVAPDHLHLIDAEGLLRTCLLYTSPSPRDRQKSRMPSSA